MQMKRLVTELTARGMRVVHASPAGTIMMQATGVKQCGARMTGHTPKRSECRCVLEPGHDGMHRDGALAWRNVDAEPKPPCTYRSAELRVNGQVIPLRATVADLSGKQWIGPTRDDLPRYGWERGYGKAIQNPDTDRWGKPR